MKKIYYILTFILCLASALSTAQVKIGDNPTTIGASSALEIESTNKGLVIPRVANTAAIANPVEGMIVFDLSSSCFKGYQNGEWTGCGLTPGQATSILQQIGNEGDSPNVVPSVVTVAQLQQLPVTDVNPAYQTYYQNYIDANPSLFSSPATVAEVQAMINAVNVLVQVGNEGDSPDAVNSVVTVAQLNQLPVTGTVPGNQAAYQDYIDANPGSFSSPATVQEIQDMINTVNAQQTILQQIGNEGDSPNTVPSVVTVAQLQQLPVTGVNPAYQSVYQQYIDGLPHLFSSPATVPEVQAMIDAVNNGVTILAQIGNEGDSPNVVPSVVTVAQLNQLPVTGVNPNLQDAYQSYIDNNPALFSAPATVAEVQAMINALNTTAYIGTMNCGSALFTPSLTVSGIAYTGSFTVPYTAGNGLAYLAGSGITSTGVTGLTATLQAGTLANGPGNLTYIVTGTPAGAGTASFAVTFAGKNCPVDKAVAAGGVGTLDCAGATHNGTLTQGAAASGVSSVISYTAGNGGPHSGQTVSSTGVTGLTATLTSGTFASGSGTLTYTITGTPSGPGTASFALNIGGQTCTLTRNVLANITIPASITLKHNPTTFIVSVNDQDYLPYTAPTGPAAFTTAQPADGINDSYSLNIQGALTTAGVTVAIGCTATGSGNLPAYSATFTIPGAYTQDGTDKTVRLSWPLTAYTAATTSITATLAAVGSNFNLKQLDMQTGIGNDALGVLLGSVSYPYNNAGATYTHSVHAIGLIPDRNVNDANHKMFYAPIQGLSGRTWLNNNLGADYSNTAKADFNPTRQANGYSDVKAFGSYFQWGRYSDGHELYNSTTNAYVNTPVPPPSSSATSTVASPNHNKFLRGSGNWYTGANPDQLWQGVGGTNNPCPVGYRLPTVAEMNTECTANAITNLSSASTSVLKFTGTSLVDSSSGTIGSGGYGYYWMSDVSGIESSMRFWSLDGNNINMNYRRASGVTVRCIKD